jgi:hypothetical protein
MSKTDSMAQSCAAALECYRGPLSGCHPESSAGNRQPSA